jgi:cysteine desulfuration protein SufE
MPVELPEALRDLLDTFELVADRSERIQLLIDIADRFHEVPPDVAQRPFPEETRVPHCESEAFVFSHPRTDGTLDYHFAVENPQGISARAMAVILDDACSGQALERVLAIPGDLPYTLFGRELSMGKNMGLTGMVALVQRDARRALRPD